VITDKIKHYFFVKLCKTLFCFTCNHCFSSYLPKHRPFKQSYDILHRLIAVSISVGRYHRSYAMVSTVKNYRGTVSTN